MKKFAFSLERVLNFKNQTLDVLKSELATLQQEMNDLEQFISHLQEVFTQTNKTLVAQMEQGVSASEINVYKVYLNDINLHIKKKLEEKEQLSFKIARKQTEIISANVEIASLDKLKQKQYEEYQKAAQKASETELEEFINNLTAI